MLNFPRRVEKEVRSIEALEVPEVGEEKVDEESEMIETAIL